jgi:hypothetical protein
MPNAFGAKPKACQRSRSESERNACKINTETRLLIEGNLTAYAKVSLRSVSDRHLTLVRVRCFQLVE